MKRMAATGGLMLLLVGCQQAFDQNPTAYNHQAGAAAPLASSQPTWQRYDGTPAWPPPDTGATASASTPLFNNSPLSPYSASASTPMASTTLPAAANAVAASVPTTSPYQQMPAAVRAASPQSTSSSITSTLSPPAAVASTASTPSTQASVTSTMVAQADPYSVDMPPVLKATAKSGPNKTYSEPAPLPPLPESILLRKEPIGEPILRKEPIGEPIRTVSWDNVHTSAKLPTSRAIPAVRMVNNKRIQLNYRIEDTGPSGVGSVEFWYTIDGHTWMKTDKLTQVGSSCITEVNDEGIYGFTLLARSGNGNAKDPPRAGDLPQVWVEVDLTAPMVALNDVKPSAVRGASHLNINWTASDRNLARRPITLSYSQTPSGPWTTFASNVDNTGQYDWAVPPSLSAKIFIKVEASDFVGNVGSAQTREAIALDTAKPSISILDVEAVGR